MRQSEFLADDLGVNQALQIDYQKRFPVTPDVFHVSRGKRLSRLSMEREVGIIAG